MNSIKSRNVGSLFGFEPTISAGERLQTYALVLAATGTGNEKNTGLNILNILVIAQ
jgi:hypothetical protein